VLAAARETFATHGLDAQIDDVAARAGVGVGTVYRHFPTKEALVEGVARGCYDAICGIARDALEQEQEPWLAFTRFMREGGMLHAGDRALAELNTVRPEVMRCVAGDKAELRALVAQLVDRAHEAGVLRADVTADDMPMIWCSLGAAQQQSGALDGDTRWERYLDVVLDGMRARARRT
jgi:AcrR family transcriptional regulator